MNKMCHKSSKIGARELVDNGTPNMPSPIFGPLACSIQEGSCMDVYEKWKVKTSSLLLQDMTVGKVEWLINRPTLPCTTLSDMAF